MAMNYDDVSKQILKEIGGAGNVASATHCMTRLRLVLKDESKANDEAVKKIKGVKGVVKQGGQYQIIIGNEVSNLFKTLSKIGNFSSESSSEPQKAEGNLFNRVCGFISGCMTPLLPAMLGTGMLKVLLVIATTFFGMDANSSSYILLYSLADSFFFFLPIFLAYTGAKKIGGNPALFMAIAAGLVYPDLIALMSGSTLELGTFLGMPCTYLFGLPVITATYSSSVIPILLMMPIMKWAEGFSDKVSPNVVKAFLKPMLFCLICFPIALCLVGPLGNIIGNGLSNAIAWSYNTCGWLTVGVLAAICPFAVMTGMHYALVPIAITSMAATGMDSLVIIAMFISNIAQGAATLAVAAKTKDGELRSEGLACGISAIVAGVTEPALYGINLRLKKPLVGIVTGSFIGGVIAGLFKVAAYSMGGSPSVLTLITLLGGENPTRNVMIGAIAGAVAIAVTFVVTFILHKDEVEAVTEENQAA